MELYDSLLMVVKQVTEQGQAGSWGTPQGESPPSLLCPTRPRRGRPGPKPPYSEGLPEATLLHQNPAPPPPGTHTVEVPEGSAGVGQVPASPTRQLGATGWVLIWFSHLGKGY